MQTSLASMVGQVGFYSKRVNNLYARCLFSTKFREERDTFGPIQVPADKYWGAQAERSLENFKIGYEKMPKALIYALAKQKKAAALSNQELGGA